MKRATPVEMRQSLEIVEELKKAGIRFVAIPVINNAEYMQRMQELNSALGRMEKIANTKINAD